MQYLMGEGSPPGYKMDVILHNTEGGGGGGWSISSHNVGVIDHEKTQRKTQNLAKHRPLFENI